MRVLISCLVFIFFSLSAMAQSYKSLSLVVDDTIMNISDKNKKVITINGQFPAPALHFTIGDTVEITVINKMHHETSIHWHGLILPNEQDGVPYLTTAPIKGMKKHVYRFILKQTGTYWYHSHTMLQEQIGMYGAFIIHDTIKSNYDHEEVLILSDWSNENPHQIERSLHFATDWYNLKKNATQNYYEAVRDGYLKTKFVNELKRMHAMDVSDVWYNKYLMNGQTNNNKPAYKKGDKIRLRVINGSASTYFWLNSGVGKFKVIASDGIEVVPVEIDRLIVGVSEIYDLEIEIPENNKSFEFRATSEDRIGYSSLWLGSGEKQYADSLRRLKYFEGMQMMNDMMDYGGFIRDMGMNMSLQQMDMNTVMYPEMTDSFPGEIKGTDLITLNYSMLKSPVPTTLPNAKDTTLYFTLTGNMNRYIWTVNWKTISESDMIKIEKGTNVKIIIDNRSMMRHPMHLHGHFFRILNGQGKYSPLKNVIDVMPMEVDTIEFHASEDYGDWYFHCHILYHMMAGMGRIFTYQNSPPNPQLPDREKALRKVYHDDRRFYLGAEIGLESNGSDGEINLMNTRWILNAEWRAGFNKETGFETESHFGRFLDKNQFLQVYTGWDFRYREHSEKPRNLFGQLNTKDQRSVLCFGFIYTLPWFIQADLRVDHTGKFRLQIGREDLALTKRIRLWAMFNSDFEYSVGARYILTKYFSASTHYDSDMGAGVGLVLTY